MKHFNSVMVGLVLVAVAGCGGEQQDVERTSSALEAVYNTAVPMPGMAVQLPATIGSGNSWDFNHLGGWIDQQAMFDGIYRTRPNVGYPSRVSPLNYFEPGGRGIQTAPNSHPPYGWVSDDNRIGYRQAMICTWDKRFPWLAGAIGQNKWCNEIPLRGSGTGTPDQLLGTPFVVRNQSNVTNFSDPSSHINDGIFQVSGLAVDFYGRCEVCAHHDFTGTCFWYGYNCLTGAGVNNANCHGPNTPTDKTLWSDIRYATGDASGNPYTDLSYKCEYGFSAPHHGP